MKFVFVLFVSLFMIGLASADDDNPLTKPSHYITGFLGESELIFGSEDGRFGGGVSYGFGRPEKRFQIGDLAAQLVYEGYVDHTQSGGGQGTPPNSTFAVGGLAYARWRWPVDRFGNGVYADFGWGLQFADQPTLDLESQLNSTPILDFGGSLKDGHAEYLLGLRFLHISNAGFVKPNYGQNELFVTFGFRY